MAFWDGFQNTLPFGILLSEWNMYHVVTTGQAAKRPECLEHSDRGARK